jgi:hypothetical protein
MRTIILTALATVALGLSVISEAPAAPANGAVIGEASTAANSVTQVQHWRWGSGGHWRWGSGGWQRGRCVRCNRSRCWRVC